MIKVWICDSDDDRVEELTMIDPKTGQDNIEDFVGNLGGFDAVGGFISRGMWNHYGGKYEWEDLPGNADYAMQAHEYDRWFKVIRDTETIESSIRELIEGKPNMNDMYEMFFDATRGYPRIEDEQREALKVLEEIREIQTELGNI